MVIYGYESLLPKGWSDQTENRALFLKPLKKVKSNGVGFTKSPRGHNITGKYLQRAMKRIGREGTYVNTQTRESFINAGVETGMRDNEITFVTGQRSLATLKSYKNQSLSFKKASSERMISSVREGGTTWYQGFAKERELSIVSRHNVLCSRDDQQLVLRPHNSNQMVRNSAPAENKLMFGKRWKLHQDQVTQRNLYDLSIRNQELLKTMLEQQNQVMKMNQASSMSNAGNLATVHKRPLTETFSSGQINRKRKKRFKQASELGLQL